MLLATAAGAPAAATTRRAGRPSRTPTPPYTVAKVSELVISGRPERGDGPLTASSEAPLLTCSVGFIGTRLLLQAILCSACYAT